MTSIVEWKRLETYPRGFISRALLTYLKSLRISIYEKQLSVMISEVIYPALLLALAIAAQAVLPLMAALATVPPQREVV